MTRLSIRTDRHLIRSHGRSQRFVLAEVTAPPATRQRRRAPVNLAFVLDRSGSMDGTKLEFAKLAIHDALARLDDRDRFSVVFYDDQIDVIVETTHATDEARRNAIRHLAGVTARGSTNLGEGWLRGCEQVAQHLSEEGVDRVLLLTDGLANQGITDPEELAHHAAELRARGVSTTTFGVGNDFDEALLQAMADAGGGHFYYIESPQQIRDLIASEVGEALEVVARDVELELLAGEGVEVEAISPHRVAGRGTRSTVGLGELVADQAIEVVFRLTFPYGDTGRETGLIVGISDRDRVFDAAGIRDARLTWTWADHAANDAQPRDTDVDRAVARQFARGLARRRWSRTGRATMSTPSGPSSRPRGRSATTPAATRSSASSSTGSKQRRRSSAPRSRRRCSSRSTSPARTWPARAMRSAAPRGCRARIGPCDVVKYITWTSHLRHISTPGRRSFGRGAPRV